MEDIPRIKGNIAKMIAQNAPESDIDAYVASEGVSLDQLKAPAAPDKYQQAAIDEQSDLKAKGIDPGAGLTRRLTHGATLGADSTIMAAAMTPLEMFKRGINPAEAYNYAKAREDQIMGDARKNTGALGSAAEVLGGGVSGAGLRVAGLPRSRLGARSRVACAIRRHLRRCCGLGRFLRRHGRQRRLPSAANALKGGLLGGVLGGATRRSTIRSVALRRRRSSAIRARINPRGLLNRRSPAVFQKAV
jgi:hypothetical protein